jgi:hypothetical protein
MPRTPHTRRISGRGLAFLAISAPAVATIAGAAPAMASNSLAVTFGADSGGVLATVNRGPKAIAGVDCTLTDGQLALCNLDSSTKHSTTYRVVIPPSSAFSCFSPTTLVVTVSLTNGRTASGSDALGSGTCSGFATAAIGKVFSAGANM